MPTYPIIPNIFLILSSRSCTYHRKQKETNADIVASTRYIPNAGVQGWGFQRKLVSRVANFVASWTLGSEFTDLTGSYRLYKKATLEELMSQTKNKGYAFQM